MISKQFTRLGYGALSFLGSKSAMSQQKNFFKFQKSTIYEQPKYYFFGGMGGGDGEPDPYKILGVNRGASQDDIKKAYRSLAMKNHPDRGGDPDKFKEINAAYEKVGDPQKRQQYDQFGTTEGAEGFGGGNPFGQGGPFGGGGAQGFSADDIFGDFFGGGQRAQQPRKVKPMAIRVNLTLEDILVGGTKTLKYNRRKTCGTCKGKGGKNVKTCTTCNGSGMVTKTMRMGPMVQRIQQPCGTCDGEGEIIQDTCGTCHGQKVVNEVATKNVEIPKGLPDQADIKLSYEGHEDPKATTGDLIVQFTIQKHPEFERKGADLYYKKKITLFEALNGAAFSFKYLDGQTINVMTDPNEIINPGTRKQIRGKGLPFYQRTTGKGNLYVDFDIVFPKKKEIQNAEQLRNIIPAVDPPKDFDFANGKILEAFDPRSVNTNYSGGKQPNNNSRRKQQEDSDDEDEDGQKVQCNQQ